MEKIDVLDEKGNITGEVRFKDDVHREGLWHRAVHVWFVNSKGELLLQHRSKLKVSHPSCWDISVAGHISAGEESITSAIRETEEEIGLTLEPKDFILLGIVIGQSIQNNGTYINNEFNDVYIVHSDVSIPSLKMQEEEVDDLKYISKEQLKEWIATKNKDFLVPHKKEYELLFEYLDK